MNAQRPIPVIMVADITGSASLHQRLDEQEAERAIDRCIKRMQRAIEAYDGQLLQQVGDEILVSFPTPEDACHAAVDMHQRIADLPPVSGHKLSIRVALHDKGNDANQATQPETLANLMRIGGHARGDQILCSGAIVAALPPSSVITTQVRPDVSDLSEADNKLLVFEINWPAKTVATPQHHSMFGPQNAPRIAERLCLRYRGQAYLIDSKAPVISLGRDPSCKLLVENRRVSRLHARIERRDDGYYLVDTSTNGSFLTLQGRREIMVRKHEALLDGRGIICFGSSANDTASERIEFEHL